MAASDTIRTTPITAKADRRDERVRLIEESVLLIRGEWPAVASGLCESINRAAGLVFTSRRTLEEAVRETSRESLRLVESLYGDEAVAEVQRLAAAGREPEPHPADGTGTPRLRRSARPDRVGQVGHPLRRLRANRLKGHAVRVHALEQADSGAEQHG